MRGWKIKDAKAEFGAIGALLSSNMSETTKKHWVFSVYVVW